MDQSFDEITADEWRSLIQKELRSTPYEELLWPVADGVTGQPDYSAANAPEPIAFIPPRNQPETWLIKQNLKISTHDASNKEALNLLNNGVHALGFEGPINRMEDLSVLLKDVGLPYIAAFFRLDNSYGNFLPYFQEYIKSQQYPAEKIRGGMAFDPIGTLLSRGNWIYNEIRDREVFGQILNQSNEFQLRHFYPVMIDATIYHNSGADATTELACALAHGNAYLNWQIENGEDPKTAASQFHFQLASGRKYFAQIAKLRAFRPLWANVCAAYEIEPQTAGSVFVTGETSARERSVRDAHTNLLRTTTQAMAAIIGGCDSVYVTPFDSDVRETNSFSQRMARNLQLLLLEEGGIGAVNDPAGGSYLFDRLSLDMMESAWKKFQEIEERGGLLEVVKSGWLQELISRQAEVGEEQVTNGRSVYIGANKYPNDHEMKVEIPEEETLGLESNQVEPLILRRATQQVEPTQSTSAS